MLDKIIFSHLLVGLGEVFDRQITEVITDIYYEALKDFSTEQVKSAVYKCIKNHKYATLPKPADILEFLEGTREDKALVAWLQLKEAVQKGGYYASIEFYDPIITHVVNEIGGWQAFCSSKIEDLPFIQKRFTDYYRILLNRGVDKNIRLIGFIEARNNEKGLAENIPETIQIGFEVKQLEAKQENNA